MNAHFEYFIPNDLNTTDVEKKEFADKLRHFYFDGKALSLDNLEEFTKVLFYQLFKDWFFITDK